MKLPIIQGIIDRRILVNYRVDPDILARLLPPPFRPQVIRGVGLAGICLIRLKRVRPTFLPNWLGISSENAAHRIAVEWHEHGETCNGVYVQRRDTNSRLSTLAGGRLFPGIHHYSPFEVEESATRYQVAIQSTDGDASMSVRAATSAQLPPHSVFESLEETSQFFQRGSLGYSPTSEPGRFQGLELRCLNWRVSPLKVEEVRSSFFDNQGSFPRGSVELDSGFLMRDIAHEWHGRADLCCESEHCAQVR